MKKRVDIQDKYDIRNCPFHLNYWTRCLIEDHLITVYDNDIFLFNQMFDEMATSMMSSLGDALDTLGTIAGRIKTESIGCSASLERLSLKT